MCWTGFLAVLVNTCINILLGQLPNVLTLQFKLQNVELVYDSQILEIHGKSLKKQSEKGFMMGSLRHFRYLFWLNPSQNDKN